MPVEPGSLLAADPGDPVDPSDPDGDGGAIPPAPTQLAPPAERLAPPAEPANPIVSWSPSGGASGPAGAAGPPGISGAPAVGWEMPDDGTPSSPVAGFVPADVRPRVLAFVLDEVLLFIVSLTVLAIAIVVADGSVDDDPMKANLLFGIFNLGLEFVYFVGFWTGGRRATPGMRLLSLRIGRAADGGELPINAAIVRFLAMGFPLPLLSSLPVAGSLLAYVYLALLLVLLVTTSSNPLHQGLHDRWSSASVLRAADASGRGVFIGCLLLVLLALVFLVLLPILAFTILGPELLEILSRVGQSI
ncbi:MAG: RDD family protein [Chloroflexi bacterium]|nr:RDD family protein [Chloroflexota bacterium]